MDGEKTVTSRASTLTPLQKDILRVFFERERRFFVTGGAALSGFYLHHRAGDDLVLVTVDDGAFEHGPHVLGEVGRFLGASVAVRQGAPGFKRFTLSRGDEALIVDLVLERAPQLVVSKPERDGVIVDAIEEILVNKLSAIVTRTEERDLVDVFFLEQAGFRIESALTGALVKDGGCTPATLSWVLSQWKIPDGARLPANVAPSEMRAYLTDVVSRLRRSAFPREGTRSRPPE